MRIKNWKKFNESTSNDVEVIVNLIKDDIADNVINALDIDISLAYQYAKMQRIELDEKDAKEIVDCLEEERLDAHPYKDKIRAIQNMMKKERDSK